MADDSAASGGPPQADDGGVNTNPSAQPAPTTDDQCQGDPVFLFGAQPKHYQPKMQTHQNPKHGGSVKPMNAKRS